MRPMPRPHAPRGTRWEAVRAALVTAVAIGLGIAVAVLGFMAGGT